MYIKFIKNKNIKKLVICLISTLLLGIFLNGCIRDPTTYCEKNDCSYCEKDSDCTVIHFFEKPACCQMLCVKQYKAININSLNKITELESIWHVRHCLFVKCQEPCTPLPGLLPVSCINNTCIPFSTSEYETCTGNICGWNASWVKEQEERTKRKSEYRWKT